MSISENNDEILHNRGNCYVIEQNYDFAHADYDKAIEINNQQSSYYLSKGRAYYQ